MNSCVRRYPELMEIVPVLANIRSVHNVGSIFRTADGAGMEEIIIAGYTPSPLDRFGKVRKDFAKVALGAEEKFVIRYFARVGGALRSLKEDGYFLLGLEQDKGSVPYDAFRKKFSKEKKIALVLGNEPEGIPGNIRKMLDAMIEIPMRGKKESLNVSVAFGVAAYELMKKSRT